MPCRWCQSQDLKRLDSEINIHIPGRHNLPRGVLASPNMRVCLRRGFTEFQVNALALGLLGKETNWLENHPTDRSLESGPH